MTVESLQPRPEHKFSFGLWTVGNRGRDPFGDFVRPPISPAEIVSLLAEVGAWGVNLHDNDLVPIRRHAARTRCNCSRFRACVPASRHCGTDGDSLPFFSSRFS